MNMLHLLPCLASHCTVDGSLHASCLYLAYTHLIDSFLCYSHYLQQPDDAKVADIPVDKKGHVDFSKDFFGRRCCLTVSGQLNVETHACALSDVVNATAHITAQ